MNLVGGWPLHFPRCCRNLLLGHSLKLPRSHSHNGLSSAPSQLPFLGRYCVLSDHSPLVPLTLGHTVHQSE